MGKNPDFKRKDDASNDVFYNKQDDFDTAKFEGDKKERGVGYSYKELCIRPQHQARNIKIGFIIKYKRNVDEGPAKELIAASKTAKASSNWNEIDKPTTIPSPQQFERLQKY